MELNDLVSSGHRPSWLWKFLCMTWFSYATFLKVCIRQLLTLNLEYCKINMQNVQMTNNVQDFWFLLSDVNISKFSVWKIDRLETLWLSLSFSVSLSLFLLVGEPWKLCRTLHLQPLNQQRAQQWKNLDSQGCIMLLDVSYRGHSWKCNSKFCLDAASHLPCLWFHISTFPDRCWL